MNQTEALNQAITGSIEESGWRSAYKKFTFLFFCWLSLLIVGTLEGVVFYLVQPRLSALSQPLAILVLSFLLFVFLILFSGLSLITITALTGIDLPPSRQKSVNPSFPIAIFLAQLFWVVRNALRTSLSANNAD